MLKLAKEFGFTFQLHPDHMEYCRVLNRIEREFPDSVDPQRAHELLQSEVMLLNLDDALRVVSDLLLLQSSPILRMDVFDWLKNQVDRVAAQKDALEKALNVDD